MNTSRINRYLLTIIISVPMASMTFAQGDKASRPSPPATASGKIGDATVTISYNSPSVKGRNVWGELVPYGKAWRAGANEATIFETDKEIKIEGKALPAGKYSLFAIPTENEWTYIFNSQTGQWGVKKGGDANMDRANDVLTVSAKPVKSATMNEKLIYEVTNNGVSLKWGNLEIPLSIKN